MENEAVRMAREALSYHAAAYRAQVTSQKGGTMTTPEMKPLTVEQIEGMRYMLNIHKAVDAVDVDRLCDMAITATLKSHPTPAKEPSVELEKAVSVIAGLEDGLSELILMFKGEPPNLDTVKNALADAASWRAAYHAQVTKEGADGK